MAGSGAGVGRAINTFSYVSSTNRDGDYVQFSPNYCTNSFPADTTVAMDEGETPISQIQIGDYAILTQVSSL